MTNSSQKMSNELFKKLLERFYGCIVIHENNRFFVESDILTNQIPESFAANAFNVTKYSLIFNEVVRLISLWDDDGDSYGISNIVKRAREDHPHKLEQIESVINKIDDFKKSNFFKSTIDLRLKIAHATDMPNQTKKHLQKGGVIEEVDFKKIEALLDKTKETIKEISLILEEQSDFDWIIDGSKKSAKSLWGKCSFKISE